MCTLQPTGPKAKEQRPSAGIWGRIRRSGGAEEESGVMEDSGNRWTVAIRGGGWALW